MPVPLGELKEHALELPLHERAELAQQLIASLDALDDAECERLWVEEAERRYQAYKAGRIPARAAEDVLRDARAMLR
jgi:putative addiction module component (TIGR02574 family)